MRFAVLCLCILVFALVASCSPALCTQKSCPLDKVCAATGECTDPPPPTPNFFGEGEGEGEGEVLGGEGEGAGPTPGATSVNAGQVSAFDFTSRMIDDVAGSPLAGPFLPNSIAGAHIGQDGSLAYIAVENGVGVPHLYQGLGPDSDRVLSAPCTSENGVQEIAYVNPTTYFYECDADFFDAAGNFVNIGGLIVAMNTTAGTLLENGTVKLVNYTTNEGTIVKENGADFSLLAARPSGSGFVAAALSSASQVDFLTIDADGTVTVVGHASVPQGVQPDFGAIGGMGPAVTADGRTVFFIAIGEGAFRADVGGTAAPLPSVSNEEEFITGDGRPYL